MKHFRTIFFIVILVLGTMAFGQKALDTLYVNELKNTALFFPSPIKKAVTGHKNFVFSYDREEAGYLGLLQALPGTESNLLVVTLDGNVFGFIVKYGKDLPQLNHFIGKGDRIGTIHPPREIKPTLDSWEKNRAHYDKVCEMLLERKPKNRATHRKKGLLLRLEDLVHHGREVFMVLQIRNRSGIDLEMDRLEVFRIIGSKKRKASYQEVAMMPVHTYYDPKKVRHGEAKRFVYVLPKFVLGDGEQLGIWIGEFEGSRKLVLKTQ